MAEDLHLSVILGAALLASASPGPATLAIANASMRAGRQYGLAVASGVTTGSVIWSATAAAGVGAIIGYYSWAMRGLQLFGALYLLYLAWKSARSAIYPASRELSGDSESTVQRSYLKGLTLHLTNPKAIIFFASVFSIGIPANAGPGTVFIVVAALALQSLLVFHSYALIFARPWIITRYVRLRRFFDTAFAAAFGLAALRVLYGLA